MRITDEVEMLLRDYPDTRNSDKALIRAYFRRKGLTLTPEQEKIFFNINTESLRRCRQKIQESGKYPATERVKKTREIKSQMIQQTIPKASPKQMDRLFSEDEYKNILWF